MNNEPEIELRLGPDGQCGVFVNDCIIACIFPEGATLRLVLGSSDAGGGLNVGWAGDSISIKLDLIEGIAYLLRGRR